MAQGPHPAKVVVIGDGLAGTAAAWSAARAGADVRVVSRGAGASALSSGAVDDVPWEEAAHAARIAGTPLTARAIEPDVAAYAEALDLWRLPHESEPLPLLVTTAGRARPARGHDRALLDLTTIAGGTVLVPRLDRAAWDADALAAAWNDEPLVRHRDLRFVPIDVALLRFEGEHRIPDADLAARHDDPARIEWLAERVREALARTGLTPSALVLGPWLGLDAARAEALGARLHLRAGEALAGAGSPAGVRFVRARDRLAERLGWRRVPRRVVRLSPRDDESERPSVTLEAIDETPARMRADRIVLACGGLTGGGILYDPPDTHSGADISAAVRPAFRLAFDVDPTRDGRPFLTAGGARAGIESSMFGADLDLTAWPSSGRQGALEAIGVACARDGLAAPYLAAAGDVVADHPRTSLVAVRSGLRAGAWAAEAAPPAKRPADIPESMRSKALHEDD